MPYSPNSSYAKYAECSCGGNDSNCGCNKKDSNCGCCPVGTVAIYNCKGEHLGCLTPNDAELYNNSQIVPPENFIKTFHPTTGAYLGNLTMGQSIELLNFLNGDGVVNIADPTFTVVGPLPDVSGFYETRKAASAGESNPILIEVDRSSMNESISMTIVDTNEDINFGSSGTQVETIVSAQSVLSTTLVWSGLTAGTYELTIRLSSSSVTRDIPVALILS